MSIIRPLRATATAALFAWILTGCGGSSGPVDGGAAMAHVEYLVKEIGARPAGSPELAQAADYIVAQLEKHGLKPERQKWQDENEKLTLQNVICQIDGEDPAAGPILGIGCHYDTKRTDAEHEFEFVGAIDGGGATGVLLELARVLKAKPPKINVWLIFLDGEESIPWEWKDERALLGSKHFVGTMLADKERFPGGFKKRFKGFVLLDLIGDKDIKIDRDRNSTKALQDLFKRAAEAMGVGDQVYRYESEFKDDHESFTKNGIPSVLLIDFAYRIPDQGQPEGYEYQQWWHTAEDTLDKMSADSLAFAGNLVMQALPELEAWVLDR